MKGIPHRLDPTDPDDALVLDELAEVIAGVDERLAREAAEAEIRGDAPKT
jgi:hypothetical protein